MKLSEMYQAIGGLINSLPDIFKGVEIDFPLQTRNKTIGDWSERSNMGMVVTGDNIGENSGVYFFAKPDGTVFYIGKAGRLHSRIWGHVNTPEYISSEVLIFPNQKFRCEEAKYEIDCVKNGSAILGVVTISNPNVAALVEVYLHTLYISKTGKLPALNKQIG